MSAKFVVEETGCGVADGVANEDGERDARDAASSLGLPAAAAVKKMPATSWRAARLMMSRLSTGQVVACPLIG